MNFDHLKWNRSTLHFLSMQVDSEAPEGATVWLTEHATRFYSPFLWWKEGVSSKKSKHPPWIHSYSKIGHFKKIEHMKIGHFKKRARDENSNKKQRESESVRILGISKKFAYAITWKIYLSHAFPGISEYPPYVYYFYVYIMKPNIIKY